MDIEHFKKLLSDYGTAQFECGVLEGDDPGMDRALDRCGTAYNALIAFVQSAPSWRHVNSDELPGGPPVVPAITVYAFNDGAGHWEYDLPALPATDSTCTAKE